MPEKLFFNALTIFKSAVSNHFIGIASRQFSKNKKEN